MLKIFLENEGDPNSIITTVNKTPLSSIVAEFGHINTLKLLGHYQADFNLSDDSGFTPIHVCASKGHLGALRVLMENGAFINASTKTGQTPILEACKYGQFHILKDLLRYFIYLPVSFTHYPLRGGG